MSFLFRFSRDYFPEYKNVPKILLNVNEFKEIRTVTKDTWNQIPNGNVKLQYYTTSNEYVGFVNYRVFVGQVGLFFLEPKYQGRGLGTQILDRVIEDMKSKQVKEIWAVTTKDHPFWSKTFTWRDPVHHTVGGHGYYKKI